MSKKRARQESQPEQNYSLPKRLAHNDKRVRDAAITALAQWLNRREEVSEVDMMKLWKGLFYCFWMSDKEAVQEELAGNMASLLHMVEPERAMLFLDCFYKTIRREWEGLDRLRMDKYMGLVRKFVFSSFQLLQRCEWDRILVVCVTTTMGMDLVQAKHRGVLMHLVDVLLPELTHLHQEGGTVMSALSLHYLLAPFYVLLAESRDVTAVKRVSQGVFEALLAILEDEQHVLFPIVKAMLPTMSNKLFVLASAPGLVDAMRNRLYALRTACQVLIVRLQLDEADILDDTLEEDEGDEGDEGNEGDIIDMDEMDEMEVASLRESNVNRAPQKATNLRKSLADEEGDEPPILVPIRSKPEPAKKRRTETTSSGPPVEKSEPAKKRQAETSSGSSGEKPAAPAKKPQAGMSSGPPGERPQKSNHPTGSKIKTNGPVRPTPQPENKKQVEAVSKTKSPNGVNCAGSEKKTEAISQTKPATQASKPKNDRATSQKEVTNSKPSGGRQRASDFF